MASQQKLTEYERKRLENIKRNVEMMAALKVHSKAAELSSSAKRQKIETKAKTYKDKSEKKREDATPVVLRRSLRTRGMAPQTKGLTDEFEGAAVQTLESKPKFSPRTRGPISMSDAYDGPESGGDAFVRTVLRALKNKEGNHEVKMFKAEDLSDWLSGVNGACDGAAAGDPFLRTTLHDEKKIETTFFIKEEKDGVERGEEGSLRDSPAVVGEKSSGGRTKEEGVKAETGDFIKEENDGGQWCKEECLRDSVAGVSGKLLGSRVKEEGVEAKDSLGLISSLTLKEENVARVVPGRIMSVKFFPTTQRRIIVVGNKFGNVGFWDMDSEDVEGDGIYLYRSHSGPVGGISIHPFDITKMFTSCYDGFLRLMDIEKEMFNLVYASDGTIFSLSQQPNDARCLFFGEGRGGLNIWDERVGKSSVSWVLHEDRINTINFKPQNPFVFATSSSDGTACIWDWRSLNAKKTESLKVISHERAVHAAYFSPSGSMLATTSFDDTVRIVSGSNFEKTSVVFHNNQTSRWISSFRAIWGWDDSCIFIGNLRRAVDVISPTQRRIAMTLESPYISAIPCRFDAHPCNVGMLAGATGGGQVYTWTSP